MSTKVASVGVPAFGQKAMAGIRSALFFASRHVRFHLVVDRLGEDDVKQALKEITLGGRWEDGKFVGGRWEKGIYEDRVWGDGR